MLCSYSRQRDQDQALRHAIATFHVLRTSSTELMRHQSIGDSSNTRDAVQQAADMSVYRWVVATGAWRAADSSPANSSGTFNSGIPGDKFTAVATGTSVELSIKAAVGAICVIMIMVMARGGQVTKPASGNSTRFHAENTHKEHLACIDREVLLSRKGQIRSSSKHVSVKLCIGSH
ncbi:LOW QUALITY PROTEIN: Serine/threonine protein kinase [Phytophthora palmivora]|uniref:Serine/threonine protein kinase n=1 Tax=Phytophthora palmivora TaxID=4796 RepID=A0A2P4YN49_9STRA|nr:LOW QUALITY PROTEIN: Serine/threonine protein kinase [Phytophthora palmivora]